ncbi:MAG TPA: glycerol-3-phosphate acyltransferase [Candidatus Nitrosotalea sp.]|nr:glycerol-3-phosphate acyltransferase [Candidatus Nitrosotalea sp.]
MELLPYGKAFLIIAVAYTLGCFAAGYYLVRWWTGEDVRSYGSGSVGATNVGRLLGRPGFALTLLVDFFKGTLAVWLADYFQLKPVGVVLTMLAVVAGHVWPVQLRFRGGKGIATCLGAMVMFDPIVALIFVALFLPFFALIRNFILGGMVAFAVLPFALFGLDYPLNSVFGLSALSVIILIAHRRNIRDEIGRMVAGRRLRSDKRAMHEIPKQ